MRRPDSWSLADVLDFEYLLARDRAENDADLRERDRNIAAKLSPGEAGPMSARGLLHGWVEARRSEPGIALPGTSFAIIRRWLLAAAFVSGLVIGMSLATTLLTYSGHEPVNVSKFLAWTLLPQMLLLLAAFLYWLDGKAFRLLGDWRPVQELVGAAVALFDYLLRRFGGDQRIHLQAQLANLAHKREVYGSLPVWPAIIVTQLFAVAFNLGILGSLFGHSLGRELRFGWQTTWEIEPATAARIVDGMALPWSWAPRAHPSEAQVIATRFAPGQDHATLPGDAMRMWWPFLFYAVAFYGLAIRGAILITARVQLRRALDHLPFDAADARALTRRLRESPDRTAPPPPPDAPKETPAHGQRTSGRCVVLAARTLNLDEGSLRAYLARVFQWELKEIQPVTIDDRQAAGATLEALRESMDDIAGVAVIIPAERDPIMAIALFLKAVIAAAPRSEVIILLHGSAEIVQRSAPQWQNFSATQHLHLGVESWTA